MRLIAAETDNGLYEARVHICKVQIQKAFVISAPVSDTWHQRLGQFSDSSVIKSKAMSSGMPSSYHGWSNERPCHDCILGKACRNPRNVQNAHMEKDTSPMDLLYSDVVGPVKCMSIGGSHNFVTIMDDPSGFSMVRCLKRKNQAADAVKGMITELESLLNGPSQHLMMMNSPIVKGLRADGAGEYVCSTLKDWFNPKGIVHEITTPKSLESNGKAERLHRTLMDSERCIMASFTFKLKHNIWAEAMNTANRIRNRLSCKSSNEYCTPYEMIFKMKPDISHGRIFGCRPFVDTPKEMRIDKFSPRAAQGTSVGYGRGCSYCIYRPRKMLYLCVMWNSTNQLITTRMLERQVMFSSILSFRRM